MLGRIQEINYNSLKETVRLWLEGISDEVDMVVLVHFEENPSYRRPFPADKNPSTRKIPLDIEAILCAEDVICRTCLRPATYKDCDEPLSQLARHAPHGPLP